MMLERTIRKSYEIYATKVQLKFHNYIVGISNASHSNVYVSLSAFGRHNGVECYCILKNACTINGNRLMRTKTECIKSHLVTLCDHFLSAKQRSHIQINSNAHYNYFRIPCANQPGVKSALYTSFFLIRPFFHPALLWFCLLLFIFLPDSWSFCFLIIIFALMPKQEND